ncbi:heme biosynthesis protein, partial [Candidatus Magnetomorum sp. HK-1]
YLFHDILNQVTPLDVDFFSFSLDGPNSNVNDAIRGIGSYDTCIKGINAARKKGFSVSLIYTVSSMNLHALHQMPELIKTFDIQRFFIQVIGIRGNSAQESSNDLQINHDNWVKHVPSIAEKIALQGIPVTYPKVFLQKGEAFECAGRVSEHF